MTVTEQHDWKLVGLLEFTPGEAVHAQFQQGQGGNGQHHRKQWAEDQAAHQKAK